MALIVPQTWFAANYILLVIDRVYFLVYNAVGPLKKGLRQPGNFRGRVRRVARQIPTGGVVEGSTKPASPL